MISLENVEVRFFRGTPLEKVALNGLNLAIEEGEFVTVIGSNGAGKSTLLGVLAAENRPTRGRVVIDGVDVSAQTEAQRAGLVARVFQDPLSGTCASLTIEENLSLAAMRGKRRGLAWALNRRARSNFRDVVATLGLGLEDRLGSQIGLLSGGQRQAVSLLMASLGGCRLLLLDEHTAALDPGTAELVLDLTRRLVGERRLTTLMVTHSMRQALGLGTRTIMLDAGRVVLDVGGADREALSVDQLLARFARTSRKAIDEDSLLAS